MYSQKKNKNDNMNGTASRFTIAQAHQEGGKSDYKQSKKPTR